MQTKQRIFYPNVNAASHNVPPGRCPDSKGNILEPADAVRIDCGGYQHWGVYVGEGNIVHMTTNGVLRQNISDVAHECPYYKDNSFDKVQRPFMSQGILSMAHNRVGERSYNFLQNNCENFVNQVRCGNAKSKQVDEYLKHHDIGNFDFVEYGPGGGTRTTFMTSDGGHRSQSSTYSASFSSGGGQGQQYQHVGIGGPHGYAHSSVTGNGSAAATSSGPGGIISSISTPGTTVHMTSPQTGPMQGNAPSTGAPGSDIKRDLFCVVCHGQNFPAK